MLTVIKIFSKSIHMAFRNDNLRISLYLVFCLIVLSTVFLSINVVGTTYRYNLGDIAREDIRVLVDVNYQIDSETEMEKRKASEMMPLVFDRDQSLLLDRLKIVDVLFENIEITLREAPPTGTEDRTFQLITLKSKLPKYVQFDDRLLFNLLKNQNLPSLHQAVKRILIYVMDTGILDRSFDPSYNGKKNITIRIVNSSQDSDETSKTIDDINSLNTVMNNLLSICHSISPNQSKENMALIYGLTKSLIKPNVAYNPDETRRRINEAIKSVKPVMGTLKKGQTIIREGDTITTDTLNKISILNKYAQKTRFKYIMGVFLLQVSFLVIFGYFLLEFHMMLLPDRKTPIIIFTIVTVFISFTFFLSRVENILNSPIIFSLYLPISAVTMAIAALFNIFIAFIIGLYVVFFSFLIGGASIPVIIMAFSSALLGVFVLNNVENRTDFLRGGLVLGIMNSIIVTGICLMEEYSIYDTFRNIELCLANGIINSILVVGIFPAFENLFGVTTKFHLLELSDLNAPIFKKMLIKAPGTYNHSLMVANMAEAACKEIGANHLLARVGGYYHDIGKIENAGLYIENKVTDKRAKALSSREYSALIISHIDKGVELAKKSKLPDGIIDFIREHHGKSLMTYFYHQALEAADSAGETGSVNKSDFQYPGPQPRSKEAAVVMLADSVEAASRSLQDPTYVKLESLVKKIIYNKLNEDELELSDLTMSDLNKVQRAFMRVLNGIFHTRIEYPDKDDLEKLEQKVMNKDNGD